MHSDIDKSDKLEARGQGLKPESKNRAMSMYGSRIIVVCPLLYFNSFFAEVLPEYFRSTEIDIFDRVEIGEMSQGHVNSREASAQNPFLILDFGRVLTAEEVEEVDLIDLYGKRQGLIRAAYKANPRAESFAKDGTVLDDCNGWMAIIKELGQPADIADGGFSQSWMKAEAESKRIVQKDVLKPFNYYLIWAIKNKIPHYKLLDPVARRLFGGDYETIMERSPEPYEADLRNDFAMFASGIKGRHTHHPKISIDSSDLKFFKKETNQNYTLPSNFEVDDDLYSDPFVKE